MKCNEFLPKLGTLLDKISSEEKTVILLGDFNIDLLKFDNKADVFKFLDTLSSYLLKPYITLPTRITEKSKSLIDNIFISTTPYSANSGNFLTGISDHLIQFSILKTNCGSVEHPKGYYKDWKNFDQKSFSDKFNNIDWKELLQTGKKNPNLSFNLFYDKLTNLVNSHVPLKKISKKQIKREKKPWVTKGIIRSMSLRDKFLKKYINAKDPENKARHHTKYKIYRNSITNLLRISKNLHYKTFFNLNHNDSKKTWEGINEVINKRKKTQPNIVLQKGKEKIIDPENIANEFNVFFSTVAKKLQDQIPKTDNFEQYVKKLQSPNSFFFSPVTTNEILTTFKSLDHSKSTGEYSIPKQLFQYVPNTLAFILQILINMTFETGIFPSALKTVKVIPVFKNKGSNQDVNNYRPISLLSNIDKIFEKLVYSRIMSFLNLHDVISNRQFGFRKNIPQS